MNVLLYLLLFLTLFFHLAKSNLESLSSVIRCATGMDFFRMFDTYNSYGCWCGYGGSGEIVVDEIDKCCQFHDKCWEASSCSWFQKYFSPSYKFKCLNKRERPPSEKHQKHDQTVGDGNNDRGVPQCVWEEDFDICAMQLCSCDRLFAECLAKLPVPSAKRECDGQWRPLHETEPTQKHLPTNTNKATATNKT